MRVVEFLKYNRGFALQKFRLDLGISFMVLINLALLVITASDKLNYYTHLPQWIIISLGVPSVLIGTWAFGYFLDKMRFQHNVNENINERNPQIQELLSQNREILRKLEVINNGRTE